MTDLPIGLRTAIETGRCVLFVGSGVGHNACDADGRAGPTGAELASDLARYFNIDHATNDLAQVAQIVQLRKGRTELESHLSKRLSALEPDPTLQWLFSLTWRAIFTTNYDRLIERSYEFLPSPTQQPVSIAASADVIRVDPRVEVPIYHLHGSLFRQGEPFVLITQQDYARFREHRRMMFELLKYEMATSPILYIGYSGRDPNWRMVTAEMKEEFAPSSPPEAYRLDPNANPIETEILQAERVTTLRMDLDRFATLVQANIGDLRVEPHRMSDLGATVPPDLRDAFDRTPPAVIRLLTSWEYLNQAELSGAPNIHEFLEGDPPNWAAISSNTHFTRDVEEPVLEHLLDFATTEAPGVRSLVLLGSAGGGITTTLKSLAIKLVQEQAGTVYYLRDAHNALEGDVEFATRLAEGSIFFFVDNAADTAGAVPLIVRRLRETGQSAMFVFGERTNEWRTRKLRISPREHLLEPLSDAEVLRLLACLERHGRLGNLEPLEEQLRIAAVAVHSEKELLVAMKEATSGKAFSAIIEDEYRSLPSEGAQALYAVVSGFHRLRLHVRADLLVRLLRTTTTDLYGQLSAETEGVVRFDEIDPGRGTDGARTRHHSIADIVWHRAMGTSERRNFMLTALNSLNLNYGIDAKAFDSLVRNDDAVDSIDEYQAKVDFFERACRKDPRSPYVRQHYARMLRREGHAEAALAQIREGLELDRDLKVLHHTRGLVLSDLAATLDSEDIARRRLAQSEEEFKYVLNRDQRDDYGYYGLAELYFKWAQRVQSAEEATEYTRRAEETISTGLKLVKQRESLWVLSADIAGWLKDSPARLAALRNAVEESPSGSLGRYLLGREYYRRGEAPQAADVLRPLVEEDPSEFRALVVYVLALRHLGRPYDECCAVLRLGEVQGVRDPRYVATYGGMLFMNGQYTDAQSVFAQADRQNFAINEADRVEYIPGDASGEPVRFKGEIATVVDGYSFVRAPGYPDFFMHGSKHRHVIVRSGMRLEFTPAFSARGSKAIDPEFEQ